MFMCMCLVCVCVFVSVHSSVRVRGPHEETSVGVRPRTEHSSQPTSSTPTHSYVGFNKTLGGWFRTAPLIAENSTSQPCIYFPERGEVDVFCTAFRSRKTPGPESQLP